MPHASHIYEALPADERQEFRLPSLLKEHLTRAAAQTGRTLAEYITGTLAERVSVDLARSTEWRLSVPEQLELLKVLSARARPSARARRVAAQADTLFGPMPRRRKR